MDFELTIILVITLQVSQDPFNFFLCRFLLGVFHFLQLTDKINEMQWVAGKSNPLNPTPVNIIFNYKMEKIAFWENLCYYYIIMNSKSSSQRFPQTQVQNIIISVLHQCLQFRFGLVCLGVTFRLLIITTVSDMTHPAVELSVGKMNM